MGTCANAREGACKIHDEYAGFQWSQAREVLGWPEGQFNIGWYCSDRICDLGRGEHLALIWESADGIAVLYSWSARQNSTSASLAGSRRGS